MLQIQKNSRQVPSDEIYTADKKYHDLLYGVMQELSYQDGEGIDNCRYVNKKDMKFQDLGDRIGLTRQTVKKKLDNLMSLGLVTYIEEEKRYKILKLDNKISTLVPFETLRRLNNSLNQNSISLFVYLLNRYIAAGEKEYCATMRQMKTFVGISVSTTSNNEVISDILDTLQLVGLVDYELRQVEENKTKIMITEVRNVMRKC